MLTMPKQKQQNLKSLISLIGSISFCISCSNSSSIKDQNKTQSLDESLTENSRVSSLSQEPMNPPSSSETGPLALSPHLEPPSYHRLGTLDRIQSDSKCVLRLKEKAVLKFFNPAEFKTADAFIPLELESGTALDVTWIQPEMESPALKVHVLAPQQAADRDSRLISTEATVHFKMWTNLVEQEDASVFVQPNDSFELSCQDDLLTGNEFTESLSIREKVTITSINENLDCEINETTSSQRSSRIDSRIASSTLHAPLILQHTNKNLETIVYLIEDSLSDLCPELVGSIEPENIALGDSNELIAYGFKTAQPLKELRSFSIGNHVDQNFESPLKSAVLSYSAKLLHHKTFDFLSSSDILAVGELNALQIDASGANQKRIARSFEIQLQTADSTIPVRLFTDASLTNEVKVFELKSSGDLIYIDVPSVTSGAAELQIKSLDKEYSLSIAVQITPKKNK